MRTNLWAEKKPQQQVVRGCHWWCPGEIGGERGINSSLLPSQFAAVREGSAVPSAWQTGGNDRKEVLGLGREKGTANIYKNMFLTGGTSLKSLRESKNYIIFLSYSSWSGSKDWKMVRTCLHLKKFLCLMVTKEYSLKAERSYSGGLEFMEEERRMARKYHEEGMREES